MSYIIYIVVATVATIVLLIILWRLYLRYTALSFNKNNKISLAGKTVLVTGANTGIGYETALQCAKRRARVIIACRDEAKGKEAAETIIRLTQNNDVVLKLLDLASLKSVRKFAEEISKSEKQLDILINNAACWTGDEKSEDGFQLTMQVNYIAPVLLTLLLLDLIKKSSPSRIVNVSSVAAKTAKDFSAEKINEFNGYLNIYSNSKLGNIFFTQILATKLKDTNVSVFSLHPGAIKTKLLRNLPKVLEVVTMFFASIFIKNASEGCQTTLYTALEPDIEHLSGSHFSGCKVVKPYSTAKNPVQAQEIWDATLKMIQFDDKNI